MYHFIANPNARSGQGLALWEKIKLKLIAEHIDYQIHFTHHRHHATEIAPGILLRSLYLVVMEVWMK